MRLLVLMWVFAGALCAQERLGALPDSSVTFTSPDARLCVLSAESRLDTSGGAADRAARVTLFRNDEARGVLWTIEKLHVGRVVWLDDVAPGFTRDAWVAPDGRPFTSVALDAGTPLGLITRDGRRLTVLKLNSARRRTTLTISIYHDGKLVRTFSDPDVPDDQRAEGDVEMRVRRGGSFDRHVRLHGPNILRIGARRDSFNSESWEFNLATAELMDHKEETNRDFSAIRSVVRNRAWPWLPVTIGTTLLFAVLCLVGRRRRPIS